MSKKKRVIKDLSIHLDLKRIGLVLKLSRENLRYSLRELAEKTEISATQLLRMESGEFEFSVVKFHSVCIALGIQISDLLEYASVRKLEWRNIFPDDKQMLDAFHPLTRKALRRIDQYLTNFYSISLWILTSTNPVSFAARVIPPPGLNRLSTVISFGSMVDGFSNVERVATLEVLIQHPYSKLKTLGLIQIEDLKQYLQTDEDWELKVREDESIQKILQFGTKG